MVTDTGSGVSGDRAKASRGSGVIITSETAGVMAAPKPGQWRCPVYQHKIVRTIARVTPTKGNLKNQGNLQVQLKKRTYTCNLKG